MRPEHWLYTIPLRLRSLFQRTQADQELDAELRDHIEQKTQEYVAQGMAPEAARRAAMIEMGGVEQAKEKCRDARGVRWIQDLAQDLRFGARVLRKSPGFTIAAVLMLALGIGANTAIFSAVNGIIFDPLPYPDASRLIRLERQQIAWGFSKEEMGEIQRQCTALKQSAGYLERPALIRGATLSQRRDVVFVSGDFFSILGIRPLLGSPITPQDTQSGSGRGVVLSYRLWMSLFGGDRRIIGRAISAGDQTYRVIGVMPKRFDLGSFSSSAESFDGLWAPMSVSSPIADVRRGNAEAMIARMKEGVSLEQLNVELKTISARLAAARPGWESTTGGNLGGLAIETHSLKHYVGSGEKSNVLVLLGAVGFVLLLACVNLSALLLARGWTRRHEIAMRRMLGAARLRIARQLLAESLLIAAAGGAVGLLFAAWGIRVLVALAPAGTPRLEHMALDGRVLAFTAGVSIFAAALFGLAPAMQAASRRIGHKLSGGWGGSVAAPATRRRHSLQNALIISEVAIAVILVTGGALMGRSLYTLVHLDTGTQPEHVLTMSVQLHDATCNQNREEGCGVITGNILDRIRAMPWVESAAIAGWRNPFGGGEYIMGYRYPGAPLGQGLYVEGKAGDQIPRDAVTEDEVSPGYFAALGVRMLKGRDFQPKDVSAAMAYRAWLLGPDAQKEFAKADKEGRCTPDDYPAAIVSESFAGKYISGNPIGKHFRTCTSKEGASWTEIIGVVGDVRDHSPRELVPTAAFYVPLSASESWTLMARTSSDPMIAVPEIERVVQSADKGAAITNVQTVEQMLTESSADPRFETTLFGSFGALGLLLAVIGIYGVISYSVAQRTHEIGVRMALGAAREDVLAMVLGQSARLALAGIALGLAGAFGLTRFLRSMLFEVTPADPATFAAVAVLLLGTALAACWIPARKAMRVDPMVALRHE
ncbi:MAG TPA: ABC transporter permease [Candidatus Acidoferrales bacterium]|nr:ABC transporter permease [Candidatus Acidoferrales bacterium]